MNQKNDKKIHFDEKEKSALLFYVYVRSPIDNYENKKQTGDVVDIHFVCSFCLSLFVDYTVISHLFSSYFNVFRRQTQTIIGNGNVERE